MNERRTLPQPRLDYARAIGLALLLSAVEMSCGGTSGSGDGGIDCTKVNPGCVDLMNFSALATNIFKVGEQPGAGNLIPPGNPGLGHATVSTAQGAKTSFTARRNGTDIATIDCTVGPNAWVSINPSVVLQPGGTLFQCQGWSF